MDLADDGGVDVGWTLSGSSRSRGKSEEVLDVAKASTKVVEKGRFTGRCGRVGGRSERACGAEEMTVPLVWRRME